ncbi:vesicle coat protein [Podospora aff. communis PSN243]|uniref:Vesicle coat protein n=1 Tax=Podospora aff. communis PSN243 TaxID=3040156 RepID=A0AAV9GH91_9PEZI|nr:vesicle coat protein [Podospora aff. communis PSN243]
MVLDVVKQFQRKIEWPDPEQSVGKLLCTVRGGRYSCWQTVGPARTAWAHVGPEIKRYLNEIETPTLCLVTASIEIYMVGKSPPTATPVVWISCADKPTRKKIRRVIKDNQFLDDYPGMKLGDAPSGPDGQTPIALGASSDSPASSSSPAEGDRVSGLQLFAYTPSGKTRMATRGPLVWIQGEPYVLTIAHFLQDESVPSTGRTVGSDLDELSFDGDSDSGETEELSDDDLLSRGSRTPDRLHSDDSDDGRSTTHELTDTPSSASPRPSDGQSSEIYSERKPSTLTYFEQPLPFGLNVGLPATSEQIGRVLVPEPGLVYLKRFFPDKDGVMKPIVEEVGKVFLTSEDGTQPGLDYALVKLTRSVMSLFRDFPSCREVISKTPSTDTELAAFTASGGPVAGKFLTGTLSYVRPAKCQEFQGTYMVNLETALREGDCGAAVMNRNEGLYGHIVAATPGTGYGYVVPADEIFNDIMRRTGHELSLRPPISWSAPVPDSIPPVNAVKNPQLPTLEPAAGTTRFSWSYEQETTANLRLLCLAHYCDIHGPVPVMVTEGLPTPCSACDEDDGVLPFPDTDTARPRPSPQSSQKPPHDFRRTYKEGVTQLTEICENCAMTLPQRQGGERIYGIDSPPESDPTLRTRIQCARYFGTSNSSLSADESTGAHYHYVDITSTHRTITPASFSRVQAACLRTLSGETLPRAILISPMTPKSPVLTSTASGATSPSATVLSGGSTAPTGPIFFGDPEAGYTTAYIFQIPDIHARDHKRVYAFLAVSTDRERVAMSGFNFLAAAFRDMAAGIQALAAEAESERTVSESSGSIAISSIPAGQGYRSFQSETLPPKSPSNSKFSMGGVGGRSEHMRFGASGAALKSRSLAKLVGRPDFFIDLHTKFVRLLLELEVVLGSKDGS